MAKEQLFTGFLQKNQIKKTSEKQGISTAAIQKAQGMVF